MKKFLNIFIYIFNCISYTQIYMQDQSFNTQNNLDIKQAVDIAYKNRPSLKALKFATQTYEFGEKVAISGYLPQLTLSSGESFASSSKGPQNSTTVAASQLLYSFAGPERLKRIARKDTEISKLNELNHKNLIRNEVEISFLQTWLYQEKKKAIETLSNSAKQTVDKAEHQDKLKLLGQNDWLTSAATYANSMANVYLYLDELLASQSQLEYLLGDAFLKDGKYQTLSWDSSEQIKVKALDYYHDLALKNRKEIKMKNKEIEKYEESEKYYKYNYLPDFNLTGQASRASQVVTNNIGVNLSWNLFDGSSKYYQSQQENAKRLKTIQERENYLQEIQYDVEKSFHDLLKYKKLLTAKDAALAQAENAYNLAKLNYKIGNISKVDLDNSMYAWENARFDWLTAKVNTAIKQSELFFACGYPENI